MFLLVAYMYATAYFVDKASKSDGIIIPMLQGFGVWAVLSI